MDLRHLADVRLLELPLHANEGGELVVIEQGKALPYAVLRMFTVRAPQAAVRGRHAHRRCSQLMLCVHGAIEVVCDDGVAQQTFLLDASSKGLLVPPTIWATETYLTEGSVLSVLCDRIYEADDYLRDYDAFLAWRSSNG